MGVFDNWNSAPADVTEEAMAGQESDYNQLPSYLTAADAHEVFASEGQWSITDPSTWYTGMSNAAMFTASALVSGAAGLYNTAVATGNMFGLDAEEVETDALLAKVDSNLSDYYLQNKGAVDTVGFIAASFIPGGLASKVMKAAKAGKMGSLTARSMNLLVPETDNLIVLAGKELANRQAAFSAFDANVVKAFGAGLRGAAVESVIVEAAVTATMYRAPMLEDKDFGDIASNLFWGGVLGGTIGGAFSAAKIYGGVKKLVTKAETGADSLKAITLQTALPSTATEADKIIMRTKDAERFATAQVSTEVLEEATIARTRAESIDDLMLNNRLSFQTLAGNDATLGNTLADGLHGIGSQRTFQNLLGVQEVGRIGKKLSNERGIVEEAKQQILNDVAGIPTISNSKNKIGFLRLHGDGAGSLNWDAPSITRLADVVADEKELDRAITKLSFKPTSTLDTKKAINADAHYLWADKSLTYRKDMVVDRATIPALRALENKIAAQPDGTPISIVLRDAKGNKQVVTSLQDLRQIRMQAQEELALELQRKGRSIQEISTITNIKESYLLGQKGKVPELDFDARLAANTEYTAMMKEKGLYRGDKLIDVSSRPQYAKVLYDISNRPLPDQFELDAMTFYAAKWKVYKDGLDRAVASVTEDFPAERFVQATDEDVLNAGRYDASSGLISSTNAGYGSLGSKMQMNGKAVADFTSHLKKGVDDILAAPAQRLLTDSEGAIEVSAAFKVISQSPEKYTLDADNLTMIPTKLKRWLDAGQEGEMPLLAEGTIEEFKFNSRNAFDAMAAHMASNKNIASKMKNLRGAQGLEDLKDLDSLYPLRKDYRDFKHFVFVVDDTITGVGHVSMIHAPDEQTLAGMIAKVPKGLKVITDSKSKLFHKAMGDYDYERTLHDNYIDSALKRAGIDSDFAITTDPQVLVNRLLNQHYRQAAVLARETARAANEKTFTALEQLAKQYTEVATSKYASSKAVEAVIDNPYENYIKTALNISTVNEHSLISGFNNAMDSAFSGVASTLRKAFGSVEKPADLELLHNILEEKGIRGAYQDAAMTAYANITPDRGALSRFVRGANSIISTLALGLDPFHALANAVGNNVLLGYETNSLIKGIKAGNPVVAGKLAKLVDVAIPGSNGANMLSGKKLFANAVKDLFASKEVKEKMLKEFADAGFDPSVIRQWHTIHEDLIITGAENAAQLNKKLSVAFDKFREMGITVTGNKAVESMNRFLTFRTIKQITDIAEEAGVYTRADSLATINTFMNRVQGNMVASQRPLVLQGPIGMAVGLFQTYQFNLLQQMFRGVAEGTPKDALMLLGMQGSIFGMNGLPAFNAINTHIIGNASGNQNHRDLYDATYGIAGKNLGDWLMYGIPSNLPKLLGGEGINLYTRGDINPRYLTVLPNELSEIPMVRAGMALWNTTAGAVQQMGAGAPAVETIIQALEHNSISRPLAGLAQVMQAAGAGGNVYATDKNSVLRGSNDLLSVTSLIRMAGGRPMDESISVDYFYRLKAYDAKDRTMMENLRSAVRKSVIQGNILPEEEYGKFAEEYLKAGGKQKNFNRFIMKQYVEANSTAAQKLSQQLGNPYAQRMQEFLRGRTITEDDLAAPLATEALTGNS